MADLLSEIHQRGEPSETDFTIAAHLLRIRDPSTGTPPMHPALIALIKQSLIFQLVSFVKHNFMGIVVHLWYMQYAVMRDAFALQGNHCRMTALQLRLASSSREDLRRLATPLRGHCKPQNLSPVTFSGGRL